MSVSWRIPFADVVITDDDRRAVDAVLASGWLSSGPQTEALEGLLSEILGTDLVLAVTNGTAALHLAAVALGVGAGDEVIVPATTMVATAAAMLQAGADIRLADSTGDDDFSLDPAEIARLASPRTKAVAVCHYGGHAVDLDAVRAAVAERGLLLIEDAAHAIGARYEGRALGTFGEAGCFSFFANKNVTTGEGGAVVFRSREAYERAKLLRSHGMTAQTWERHQGHASGYDVVAVGFNYRIDELRATLGMSQLGRLSEVNDTRRLLVERYRARLPLPGFGGRGEPSYHLAPLLTRDAAARDRLREVLRAEGIQTSVHYPSISSFSHYAGGGHTVPRSESIGARVVTLPLHTRLTEADVDEICDAVLAADVL